jgi:hypothetical protein
MYGEFFVQFRGLNSAPMTFQLEDTNSPLNGERISLKAAWAESVVAQQGTQQQVKLLAQRQGGAGSLQIYGGTIVVVDIQFSEKVTT